MSDKQFIEATKEMSSVKILNYYRNLYYNDGTATEKGIVANAINDILSTNNRTPCYIGDIFYEPVNRGMAVDKLVVSGLTQKANGTWKIRVTNKTHKYVYEILESDIGKIVFYTPEEAKNGWGEK